MKKPNNNQLIPNDNTAYIIANMRFHEAAIVIRNANFLVAQVLADDSLTVEQLRELGQKAYGCSMMATDTINALESKIQTADLQKYMEIYGVPPRGVAKPNQDETDDGYENDPNNFD